MNKIEVTFSTTAGDFTDKFPENQPLHAIEREVMGKLKLDPSQAPKFCFTRDGNRLDENQTLGALGIPNGAILILERCDVVKI